MLHKTNAIILRSVKYGETSLVVTAFTDLYGVQTYMVQGVRTAKSRQNRAAFFQPGTLLELVVYHQPQKTMQRIREFQAAYIYNGLQEDVVKNSIVLFSVEVLLRLLPELGPLPSLFTLAYEYFIALDKMPLHTVANFPLFFIIECSRELGYTLKGQYTPETPYLNSTDGGFTDHAPAEPSGLSDDEARALSMLLQVTDTTALNHIEMNAGQRLRLIDWYVAYLQQHTQHMGNIRSLSVLRAILH
jgi:DNA repair protein RecO (recombination protein O)